MKQIPPHILKQLQAGGMGFPGGMQMPPGMRPPMGMPMMPQQQQQAAPPDKAKHNPLPPGRAGLKIMKAFAQCSIMEDSDLLNKLIERFIEFEDADEYTEITEKAGLAIATLLQSDRACEKHTKQRTVVTFEKDPELQQTHEDLIESQNNVERLQKELSEAVQTMQGLMHKRWETAVKNFGLSPENHFYTINEEDGSIDLVELDCPNCKGHKRVSDMRKDLAQQVLDLGKKKAEEVQNNDRSTDGKGADTPEGSSEKSGETVLPKQEVSSVVDTTTTDGGDGGNSSDKTT